MFITNVVCMVDVAFHSHFPVSRKVQMGETQDCKPIILSSYRPLYVPPASVGLYTHLVGNRIVPINSFLSTQRRPTKILSTLS